MRFWYQKSPHLLAILLFPLSLLFSLIVNIRYWCYRYHFFSTETFSVPVIVVGNLTVGGTGKTPFVIGLVKLLVAAGLKPGIVSRGIGGERHQVPHRVSLDDLPNKVGDEALLILSKTERPLVVGIDRALAVKTLLAETDCNIVISDDGLQHYKMQREIEIVMVDGERRFGNGFLLPAGPLRESVSRLNRVDWVLFNEPHSTLAYHVKLVGDHLLHLQSDQTVLLSQFQTKTVHAVAAIGNPNRFFNTLKNAGFNIITHVFPDHYLFNVKDLDFGDELPIIMTEKDAIKCRAFFQNNYWSLPVEMELSASLENDLLTRIIQLTNQKIGASHESAS